MDTIIASKENTRTKVGSRTQKLHTNIRPKLDDIDDYLMWGQLAEDYFDDSSTWIYDKFRGFDKNGMSDGFTDAELIQLKGALCDLADRIRRAAESL